MGQINGVEIHFKYFVLGILLLNVQRSEYFLHLTLNGSLVFAGNVLYKLLCYGTSSAVVCAGGYEEVKHRREGTLGIHALVVPITLVLYGNVSVDKSAGNGVVVYPQTVFAAVETVLLKLVLVALVVYPYYLGSLIGGELKVIQARILKVNEVSYINDEGTRHRNTRYRADKHYGKQYIKCV